ncbi:MAG: hypothetical protein HKN91_13245 [Acidimicrobiia bacterium]|nr:hypothetical protein [Acidimicrobiia bacterium]
MSKPKLLATSVLLAFALVISMGIASGGVNQPYYQAETPPSEDSVSVPGITPLAGFVAPSPSQPWVTEVRLPVVIENVGSESMPADLSSLRGLSFELVDASGERHGIDTARPQRAALPNHSLAYLDPAMAARWTLGFQVPTEAAWDLVLELVQAGEVIASWNVDELQDDAPTLDTARAADLVVELDETFDWHPGVVATATGIGSLVCGDPTFEAVTQIFTVTFSISNTTPDEVRWPGYIHRDGFPAAQWADGTAADMTMETFAGGSEWLPRVSTFAVRIPTGTNASRALVFGAPRDGRFVDVTQLPSGVMLVAGDRHVWLDLEGAEATVPISPQFCDIGFFGAPLPFGQAPGVEFQVIRSQLQIGGEDDPTEPGDADPTARLSITEALAGAALFYDRNGQTFAGVTGDALASIATRLDFEAFDVDEEPLGEAGVIYFGQRPNDAQYLVVVTRSTSGRWFCAGVTPHQSVVAADSNNYDEIAGACAPDGIVEDA